MDRWNEKVIPSSAYHHHHQGSSAHRNDHDRATLDWDRIVDRELTQRRQALDLEAKKHAIQKKERSRRIQVCSLGENLKEKIRGGKKAFCLGQWFHVQAACIYSSFPQEYNRQQAAIKSANALQERHVHGVCMLPYIKSTQPSSRTGKRREIENDREASIRIALDSQVREKNRMVFQDYFVSHQVEERHMRQVEDSIREKYLKKVCPTILGSLSHVLHSFLTKHCFPCSDT